MYELSVRVAHEHQLTSEGRPVDVVDLVAPDQVVVPGVQGAVAGHLRTAYTDLVDASATRGVDGVTGLATRIGLTVPDDRADAVGRRLARHCLGALADVVGSDPPGVNPGIAVRPRPGWVEVRSEHVDGADLDDALVLLTGCVVTFLLGAGAPTTARPRLSASRGRPGWFAEDPGRGDLTTVWAWARTGARAAGLDPTALDDLVERARPLRRDRQSAPVPVATRA